MIPRPSLIVAAALLLVMVACESSTEPPPSLDWRVEIAPSPALVGQHVEFTVFIRNTGTHTVSYSSSSTEFRRLENDSSFSRVATGAGGATIAPETEVRAARRGHTFSRPGTYELSATYTGLGLTAKDTLKVLPSN